MDTIRAWYGPLWTQYGYGFGLYGHNKGMVWAFMDTVRVWFGPLRAWYGQSKGMVGTMTAGVDYRW